MKLIKKSHQPIIKKTTTPEPPQENLVDDAQPIAEDLQSAATEDQTLHNSQFAIRNSQLLPHA